MGLGCPKLLMTGMLHFKYLLLLLLIAGSVQAQKWEPGVFVGGAGYQGDLNSRNTFQVSGMAAGLLLRYNFNGHLSAKASITGGHIEGADSTSSYEQVRSRNLSFLTNITEVALTAEFNFFDYQPGLSVNRFTPFVFAGISSVYYNPQATYHNQTYDLRPLQTEQVAYSKSAIAVPFGIGIKYNIWKSMSIAAEAGYRTAYTDYLDDVSGLYAARESFTDPLSLALSDRSGERTNIYTGATGTQRGDLRPHDSYMFFGINVSYTFLSSKCYTVR